MSDVIDKPLGREEALDRLRALEPELRAKGLVSLYLYGSVSRNEAGPESDVDLFCEIDPRANLGWRYFGIGPWIEERLMRPVQLGTRSGLHEMLKERIERSAVKVF